MGAGGRAGAGAGRRRDPTPAPHPPNPTGHAPQAAKLASALAKDVHYTVDEKQRSVLLTEEGYEAAEDVLQVRARAAAPGAREAGASRVAGRGAARGGGAARALPPTRRSPLSLVPPFLPASLQVSDLYDPREQWASYLINAIKAKELFLRDVGYIVRKDEVRG